MREARLILKCPACYELSFGARKYAALDLGFPASFDLDQRSKISTVDYDHD
jgi:hypothetical protein